MSEKPSIKSQVLVAIITGLFIIGAAILSSPQWFKIIFPNKNSVQKEIVQSKIDSAIRVHDIKKITSDKHSNSGTENLDIYTLEISPINFNLPNYFLLEIKNKGTKNLINVNITINFGKASYSRIEFIPKNNISLLGDTLNKSFIKLESQTINRGESIYIYALLSQPVFHSILIDGSNLTFSKVYTYNEYLKTKSKKEFPTNEPNETSGWTDFLMFLFGAILVILSLFFLGVVYTILSRIMHWEE